jgi:signal transduction histidine kinase
MLVDSGETSVPFTEERLVKKDGAVVVASIGGLNIHFDGRPMVVAVCRDMTERRAQLTQMAQAERMAALGALSAGVAHEINNPLTYVILRLDIISSISARAARLISELHPDMGEEPRTPSDRRKVELSGLVSDLSGHVSTAKEGANRVRTIVSNLRVFSRAESEPLMPVDIHGPLELALGLAHHELKQRATVHREFEADTFVMGTEGKLAQVFLQLLLNAAHAIAPGMPEKQHVSIRTRRQDDAVVVLIEDTGEGIPVENIPRVFEPFFTTRAPNAGMGLGLSMVHGIVTVLGGTISVEPREEGIPTSGTRFTVSLPRATPFIEDEHEDDRDEGNDLYYRSRDA